ncbi:hypothetical protein MLD38_017849 [Melastoma candidum]|uniref:Uncharacterized protein n=1 Tax=Melastoma candidum TaxID=119954 RepID=A0ACB9QW16_9MYRT|nr:hypothetical protein MLD38_017849 [Melastoma candidum]
MANMGRILLQNLHRTTHKIQGIPCPSTDPLQSWRSYRVLAPIVPMQQWQASLYIPGKDQDISLSSGNALIFHQKKGAKILEPDGARYQSTQAKAPPQVRQMGALQVSMLSPGFVYEPYTVRKAIPFWKRWFTRTGWQRTKDDILLELKSAYAIAKLRKSGYSKQEFYGVALKLYKEINFALAHGDKKSLRKAVTEKMYSTLKHDIKTRESLWSKVYWELVDPPVKIRTLRARLIGVDRNDVNKVFVQITIDFLTKQKFEAYDSNGSVVAGDKNKEVLVRDIWVFEKSLFHTGAYWRLCGKIVV